MAYTVHISGTLWNTSHTHHRPVLDHIPSVIRDGEVLCHVVHNPCHSLGYDDAHIRRLKEEVPDDKSERVVHALSLYPDVHYL